MQQLTTLAQVRAWLKLDPAVVTDDALLNRLIKASSNAIYQYLSRSNFALSTVTELQDGQGNQKLTLRSWPVQSVTSINTSAGAIRPQSGGLGQPGYILMPANNGGDDASGQPQIIALNGQTFPIGVANIEIVYTAGYVIEDEAQTIPGSTAYTLQPQCPLGPWLQDDGVTLADGTALVAVTGVPATGQYKVTTDATTGLTTYTFNVAQANAGVLLNYSYTPADIEQAAIEMVAERYRYKARIGKISESMGGQETQAYSQKDITDYVKLLLDPYRLWFPL